MERSSGGGWEEAVDEGGKKQLMSVGRCGWEDEGGETQWKRVRTSSGKGTVEVGERWK